MIDKNFYLENLSAFDILIQDEDRKQAEEVIFRVYSILQRDKIWLRDHATEEEIFEEDAELLAEVDLELKELDEQYGFRFDEFYKLVQQEMMKLQSTSNLDASEGNGFEAEDVALVDDIEAEFGEEEDNDFDSDEDDDEDFYEEEQERDEFSHLSDDELSVIEDYILASAKTRFNYSEFLEDLLDADEDFVDGEFLLPIIAGKAFGDTDAEIAEKMISSFMLLGYNVEIGDLIEMIEQKSSELGPEILAFKIAADSLQQGAHPSDIIPQISQLLRP